MAVTPNFAQLLGNNSNAGNNGSKADDRPKAQVWCNVGYLITVPSVENPDVQERVFVALPTGIPLDNVEPLDTRGKKRWANFQHARNELTKKLAAMGMDLDPGATIYFPENPADGQLVIEIRRVNEDTTPDSGDENIFLPKF